MNHRTVKEITSTPIEQGWFKDETVQPVAMRHAVMVRKVAEDGTLGETLLGYIVTNPGQSLDSYCSMHGYWIEQSYPVTKRVALRGETTELF